MEQLAPSAQLRVQRDYKALPSSNKHTCHKKNCAISIASMFHLVSHRNKKVLQPFDNVGNNTPHHKIIVFAHLEFREGSIGRSKINAVVTHA